MQERPLSLTWTIINAEIIAWAKAYTGPRFHNLICDPPYALEFLGLTWDRPQVSGSSPDDSPVNLTQMRQYQQWVSEWAEALIANVLYPGAVCALFGGPRTFHRLAAGLEDGGFEIFDVMMWHYGQGMAKGQNLDKAMDGAAFKTWLAGIEHGLTSAEKRLVVSAAIQGGVSYEERHGRTYNAARSPHTPVQVRNLSPDKMDRGKELLKQLIEQHWVGPEGTLPPGVRLKVGERRESSGYKSVNANNASISFRPDDYYADNGDTLSIIAPATAEAQAWLGFNTGLKPAWEPVILCRAPRKGKSFVALAQTCGSGALNIDAGRIPIPDGDSSGHWMAANTNGQSRFNGSPTANGYRTQQHPAGRWPANVGLVHAEICQCVGLPQVKGITGSETVEACACACGCPECGAEWAAETLITCPECGGRRAEWHCPVKLLDEQAGPLKSGSNNVRHGDRNKGWSGFQETMPAGSERVSYGDTGPASRFFYAAKVSPREAHAGCDDLYWRSDPDSPTGYRPIDRAEWETLPERERKQGNIHPTRKPIRLIEYLARLILPPGPVKPRVCIPFSGSGSEGVGVLLAAKSLGINVEITGIENEATYCAIAEKRLQWWAQVDDCETVRQSPRSGSDNRQAESAPEKPVMAQLALLEAA